MKYADARPRIYIWRTGDRYAWSNGPAGVRSGAFISEGLALDHARSMGRRGEAVVILEPEVVHVQS